jgi:hypothetical protein
MGNIMDRHHVSWSFGSIALGYLASALASATSLVMFMTRDAFDAIVPMVILGTGITLMAGLPGFAAALFVCRRTGWQSSLHFALAGGSNALLAALLYFGPDQFLRMLTNLHGVPGEPLMLTSYFGAGFVGGMTYWAVARWFALRNGAVGAAA